MKKCEEILAEDPTNAEALAWHGSGMMYYAEKEFIAGNVEKGRQIQAEAVARSWLRRPRSAARI